MPTPLEAPVGALLPPEVLARRDALPRKPAAVELVGRTLRLRPLDLDRDLEALHAVSCGRALRIGARAVEAYDADACVWRYMSGGPFADAAALGRWLRPEIEAPDGRALCVVDLATHQPLGVVNYLANQPEHLKIEI